MLVLTRNISKELGSNYPSWNIIAQKMGPEGFCRQKKPQEICAVVSINGALLLNFLFRNNRTC
jgi:hypothetical protein